MNKTKIEWCDQTWNPVTGCLHQCQYCYACRIANRFRGYAENDNGIGGNRYTNPKYFEGKPMELDNHKLFVTKKGDVVAAPFPYGFWPTFHKYRLGEPAKLKKQSKIFVCSMADLFGEWVPAKWIFEILKATETCSHTFMFLTKNPQRYLEYLSEKPSAWPHTQCRIDFPDNCWAGVSVTDFNSWMWVQNRMHHILSPVRFISIEPLISQDIATLISNNGIPEGVNWVIIGAQTGPGAKPPKAEWIQAIVGQAKEAKIPVFMKGNLQKYWQGELIQEWPEDLV